MFSVTALTTVFLLSSLDSEEILRYFYSKHTQTLTPSAKALKHLSFMLNPLIESHGTGSLVAQAGLELLIPMPYSPSAGIDYRSCFTSLTSTLGILSGCFLEAERWDGLL